MQEDIRRAAEMAIASDRALTIDYIRTTMNPRQYNVMPDNTVESANSVSIAVDYAMTFTTVAPLVPIPSADPVTNLDQSEACASRNGLILHLPKYGPLSLVHMGFVSGKSDGTFRVGVPGRLYSTTPNVLRGLGLGGKYTGATSLYTPWAGPATADAQNACGFAWLGTVALPRCGTGAISIGPNVGLDFSRVRTYAAIVQAEVNAVSVGSSTITGAFTTSVIADTRALSAVTVGTTVDAFPATLMAQQSVARADVLKTVKVEDGVTMLIGPDYDHAYNSPDRMTTARLNGEMRDVVQQLVFHGSPFFTVDADTYQVSNPPIGVCSMWVTPWATNFGIGMNGPQGVDPTPAPNVLANGMRYHNIVNVGAIDEMGSLDVEVSFKWMPFTHYTGGGLFPDYGPGMDVPVQIIVCNTIVLWTHVFCVINDNGTIQYNTFSETETIRRDVSISCWADAWGPNSADNLPVQVVRTSARKHRVSFTASTGGKYMGTYCQLAAQIGVHAPTAPSPTPVTINYTDVKIRVAATTIDEVGAIGPAHITRYDGIGQDQQLIVRGVALVEGVANGGIAPYMQMSIPRQLSVSNPRVQQLIRELYQHSPYFKRCVTTKEYNSRIVPYLDKLTPQQLAEDARVHLPTLVAVIASGLVDVPGTSLSAQNSIRTVDDTMVGMRRDRYE